MNLPLNNFYMIRIYCYCVCRPNPSLMSSRIFALFLTAVSVAVYATDSHHDLVLTPFGRVKLSCVHYFPKGAVVKELANHTELHHADGRVEKFEACDSIDPRSGRDGYKTSRKENKNGPNSLDLDGWIDYTGWYPAKSGYNLPITSFVASNSVPDTPTNTSGQTLYWFIGTQNNEDAQVRILQPVLTFNGVGGGATGAPEGWSFMSWNCCPRGQVWYSDPVTDFSSGDTLLGEIVSRDGGASYDIISSTPSSSTTLTVDNTDRLTFDWADVTLEVYSVTSCDMFPTKPVLFTDIAIASGGTAQVTPTWTIYQGSSCHDAVTVQSSLEVDIAASP